MGGKIPSHNVLKLILFIIIACIFVGLIWLIFSIYQSSTIKTRTPQEFISSTRQKYNTTIIQYNQVKADLDQTINEPQLITQTSIQNLEDQVYELKRSIANLLSELYQEQNFETQFHKDITTYLETIYNDPQISKNNFEIYQYYLLFNNTQNKFNLEFKSKISTADTISELNLAQSTISFYLPQFEKIQSALASRETSPEYSELTTSINSYIKAEINYLTTMRNYYSTLTTLLTKNFKPEAQQIITQMQITNQNFLISSSEIQQAIQANWQLIQNEKLTFNKTVSQNRDLINKLYEELSIKYKI